ncbi:hypothetical protein [Paracoccus sp. SSK6]|uniref:hypothetical protein n=1 Tax=Paracoccus sp. SSK6 TaxID=3143131 RepID=UPI00321A80D8
MADLAGYSEAEIKAGEEFFRRKSRNTNPPGSFDRAGRFTADERTEAVRTCRSPSRAYPWPEMHAARTAAHCAEVHGVPEDRLIAVRRFAKAVDRLIDGDCSPDSAADAARLFKKKIKKSKAKPEINVVADCSGAKSALHQVREAARRMVYDNAAGAAAVRAFREHETPTRDLKAEAADRGLILETTYEDVMILSNVPENESFKKWAEGIGARIYRDQFRFPANRSDEVRDAVLEHFGTLTWFIARRPYGKHPELIQLG